MKLSDFFFFSRLSSGEEAILTATQGASQPSIPSCQRHRVCMCTHTSHLPQCCPAEGWGSRSEKSKTDEDAAQCCIDFGDLSLADPTRSPVLLGSLLPTLRWCL